MADQKPSNRERVKEIVAGIEGSLQQLFQSEKYLDYLRTMSRFHHYSFNNSILIYMQMPSATRVAGFNKWKNEFGRHVKKGEKGITILAPTPYKKRIERQKLDPDTQAPMLDEDGQIITEERVVEIPMFRPVKVFDVSQTEGRPLPALAATLTGDVQEYEVFMEALRRTSPVPISFKALQEKLDGYFDSEEQSITVREGMSQVQTICATVHEIAHSILHNKEQERLAAEAGGSEPPKPKDRKTEEVEAESVSYAVCQYYGIDTSANSMGYIAGWSSGRDLKELRSSLETITRTVSGLIADIDRHFAEICKERGIDRSPQPEQDGPDTPEKFAADMVDFMDQLYGSGTLDYRFSLASREETVADLTDEIARGCFAGIRRTLAVICEKENLPTAKDLLERMETISDQRDAALFYHTETNLAATGDADRSYILAYEKSEQGRLASREVIYVGTTESCLELTKKLNNGGLTARAVRELDQAAPDSPERFVTDLLHHMESLCSMGLYPDPCNTLRREQIIGHYLDCLRHGSFSSAYDLLHDIAKHDDTLTVSSLRERLDKLSDEWDAGLSYEVKPYFPGSSVDRASLEANREAVDGFQYHAVIFSGSEATCLELKQKLEEGSISPRAVRELGGEAWPEVPAASFEAPKVPTASQAEEQAQREAEQWGSDEITGVTVTGHEAEPLYPLDRGQPEEALPQEDTVLDEYPLPDATMGTADLEAAGYHEGDMLPLSRQRAAALIDQDFSVYAVTGGGAELLFDQEEVDGQEAGTVFSVPREEWEASPDFKQAVAARMEHQEERETAFLNHGGNCFAIYQVKLDDPDLRYLRYEPLERLEGSPQHENYELAYTAPLPDGATLDTLWERFNTDHPADYQRPSLSMSDIVALKQDGMVSCHYVDRIGFAEIPGFLPQDDPQKNAELAAGDDCGKIGSEGPTVAELEAQVKAGQTISLLDLYNATAREQSQKRSVREKLRQQSDKQERKQTAPKKGAERER